MKRLRVSAGPSLEEMTPISVNTSQAHKFTSDLFDGQVAAYIKGFIDEQGQPREHEYFERADRQGITWSIQVQGRFLVPYSADDVLLGNSFDYPPNLPWGTVGPVTRFIKFLIPTAEHNIHSHSEPWALSTPLIATVPHFAHERLEASEKDFPLDSSLKENTSQLSLATARGSSDTSILASPSSCPLPSNLDQASSIPVFKSATQRRSYFRSPEARQKVIFGPSDLITTDFCHGYVSFSPSLSLQLPYGLSFDLAKYWEGQPVRFMCCERRQPGSSEPWGRTFWCVSIELVAE